MAETNRWAIREVAIARFYDLVTGALKVKLDTLKTSGLENTSAVVYANGSRGNPKLVGFTSDRAARFTLQDALFTNELIGMLTGNGVVTGETEVEVDDVVTVASNSATIRYTPSVVGAVTSVNRVNPDGTTGIHLDYVASTPTTGKYSITGKSLTFASGDFVNGDKVCVSYSTTTGEDAKLLKATTNKFAGTYRLILDVLVRDAYLKQDFQAQIVVPNAKIEDAWNLPMNATGDVAVLDIPMEALKAPASTDLYNMVIYDETELV